MQKLATLFSDSLDEFKKTRTVAVAAMFGAISVALGYFGIEIGNYIKISFSAISNQFVYYMFGPVVGGCFGGALDILKFIVKPTGPFTPGLTISAVLEGVLYGMILYRRPLSIKRVLAAQFIVALICNVMLGTLWLSMLYGKGFMVLLPARAVKNLVMWPVNSMLFYTIGRKLESAGVFRVCLRGLRRT